MDSETDARRLPAVRALSSILPKGTEGGKEFARIVSLLLIADAKRHDKVFKAFDDAAGDFEGLDSFEIDNVHSENIKGFQYKFYPSPLTNDHRKLIKESLERALAKPSNTKLTHWTLVTPDDLTNSGRRRALGDVEWFENLRKEFRRRVAIEHLGHTKLINLFLQTPQICLYYYPSLVQEGLTQRKTIKQLRTLYDRGLQLRHGKIEFVGMSIYKEEASRRIPLEKIYIPLHVVPELSGEEEEETPRIDPVIALESTGKSVILGDPGSGKSTLLSFLALVGSQPALQKRCGVNADGRLAIIITLRRYADELKTRSNLTIVDYVTEVARADFNIDTINSDFFLFHIESGNAVLLFDGLDELPGSHFKSIIRERIETFDANYPANTIIVTSRIVGYEAEIRFGNDFNHFRVSKLKLEQMTRFIADWYKSRIDDVVERNRNSTDLIKVIEHSDNYAIRDLARNPLLLTIVALVHRIDAVLPDQRVVLYQKCTETLLNTWYRAKNRDAEAVKGRIERRNRLRVEAIAYWMHKRSVAEEGRSVVTHQELLSFLSDYIDRHETIRPNEDRAEDQAEDFVRFIKNSAGLMIEAGDNLYSFIHLTFQEYLSATSLAAFGESGGVQTIWDEISYGVSSPRWREIVRLLVASLRTVSAQRFFVDAVLKQARSSVDRDTALLSLGLLRDAIEPAEEKAADICRVVVDALLTLSDGDDIRALESALAFWSNKNLENARVVLAILAEVSEGLQKDADLQTRGVAKLINTALFNAIDKEIANSLETDGVEELYLDLPGLIDCVEGSRPTEQQISSLWDVHSSWAMQNPVGNTAAAIGLGITLCIDRDGAFRKLFDRQLRLLTSFGHGPHQDFGYNIVALTLGEANYDPLLLKAFSSSVNDKPAQKNRDQLGNELRRAFESFTRTANNGLEKLAEIVNSDILSDEAMEISKISDGDSAEVLEAAAQDRSGHLELYATRSNFSGRSNPTSGTYLRMLLSSPVYTTYLAPSLIKILKLRKEGHWRETLRGMLDKIVPKALRELVDIESWKALHDRLGKNPSEVDELFAAWLLLFETWIAVNAQIVSSTDSSLNGIAIALANSELPEAQLALAIRSVMFKHSDPVTEFQRLANNPRVLPLILRNSGLERDRALRRHTAKRARTKKAPITIKSE